MLLDVGFNREVALDSAVYWTKEDGNLASLIDKVETFTADEIAIIGKKAKKRIKEAYSWEYIASEYEEIFN
jgi:rhamnosyltransferase